MDLACLTPFSASSNVPPMRPSDESMSFSCSMRPLRSLTTLVRVPSADWLSLPPSFVIVWTSVLLTVETNVALIWESMVVAPVSVIFGAMAFFFSLT